MFKSSPKQIQICKTHLSPRAPLVIASAQPYKQTAVNRVSINPGVRGQIALMIKWHPFVTINVFDTQGKRNMIKVAHSWPAWLPENMPRRVATHSSTGPKQAAGGRAQASVLCLTQSHPYLCSCHCCHFVIGTFHQSLRDR